MMDKGIGKMDSGTVSIGKVDVVRLFELSHGSAAYTVRSLAGLPLVGFPVISAFLCVYSQCTPKEPVLGGRVDVRLYREIRLHHGLVRPFKSEHIGPSLTYL